MRENMDQNNSKYGRFLRSVTLCNNAKRKKNTSCLLNNINIKYYYTLHNDTNNHNYHINFNNHNNVP